MESPAEYLALFGFGGAGILFKNAGNVGQDGLDPRSRCGGAFRCRDAIFRARWRRHRRWRHRRNGSRAARRSAAAGAYAPPPAAPAYYAPPAPAYYAPPPRRCHWDGYARRLRRPLWPGLRIRPLAACLRKKPRESGASSFMPAKPSRPARPPRTASRVEAAVLGLRDEQCSDHDGDGGEDDGVPKARVDVAAPRRRWRRR